MRFAAFVLGAATALLGFVYTSSEHNTSQSESENGDGDRFPVSTTAFQGPAHGRYLACVGANNKQKMDCWRPTQRLDSTRRRPQPLDGPSPVTVKAPQHKHGPSSADRGQSSGGYTHSRAGGGEVASPSATQWVSGGPARSSGSSTTWPCRENVTSAKDAAKPAREAMMKLGGESRAQCHSRSADSPLIAVCVAGAAREFTSDLVFTSFINNVVVAMHGQARIFMVLKSGDTLKAGMHHVTNPDILREEIAQAFKYSAPWAIPLLRDVVVLNGSGSPPSHVNSHLFDSSQPFDESQIPILQADGSEWTKYRLAPSARCREDQNKQKNNGGFLNVSTNEERLINSNLGAYRCLQMIRFEERVTGRKFDWVVYTRPDLFLLHPVAPWCTWGQGKLLVSSNLGNDGLWAVPRIHADTLLNMASLHRDCTEDACCKYNEALLGYAARQSVLKVNKSSSENIKDFFDYKSFFGDELSNPATSAKRFIVIRDPSSTCALDQQTNIRPYPALALRQFVWNEILGQRDSCRVENKTENEKFEAMRRVENKTETEKSEAMQDEKMWEETCLDLLKRFGHESYR